MLPEHGPGITVKLKLLSCKKNSSLLQASFHMSVNQNDNHHGGLSACTNCQNQEAPGLPIAPISGSPGDQSFSLTFRNSTTIFLNSHLWSKTTILKLNNT